MLPFRPFSMHVKNCLILFILAGGLLSAEVFAVDGPGVTINTDFSGGNVKVIRHDEQTVILEPDLRGGRPWFYWCFEATADKPGRVTFQFPEKVAGHQEGAVGFQGPAISTDSGKNWDWLGKRNLDGSSFFYDFKENGESVRFAVTIPYLQTDLEQFLQRHSDHPLLKKSVLTKSLEKREVELLQVGEVKVGKKPVLFTARHHAVETMASFVLEGFLKEALSGSEEAKEFHERYVLFIVPFVDKDGVENGDQGKNRKPHDHNRDYGENSIYPEVIAIKELDKKYDFQFALDFHCPTLVMPDHQVIYFVGAKQHPPYNYENVKEFASWIKKGLPESAPVGPLVWLRDEHDPSPKSSRYFGFKENAIMSATLEFPFAPPNKATDPESCRKYGAVILHAWVNTHFLSANK